MGARFHTIKRQPVYGSTIGTEMGNVLLRVGHKDEILSNSFYESEDGNTIEVDKSDFEEFVNGIDTNDLVKSEVAKYADRGYSVNDFKECCDLILKESDKESGTIFLENY